MTNFSLIDARFWGDAIFETTMAIFATKEKVSAEWVLVIRHSQ
jgi:hypothetical protein